MTFNRLPTNQGPRPRPTSPTGSAAEHYLSDRTATATPAELTGMLFDAALANIRLGSAALESGDRPEAHRRYSKAQDIVMELRSSLNHDAGEIADRLDGIYAWVYRHLVTATIRTDRATALAAAAEALRCLEPIAAAWAEVAGSTRP